MNYEANPGSEGDYWRKMQYPVSPNSRNFEDIWALGESLAIKPIVGVIHDFRHVKGRSNPSCSILPVDQSASVAPLLGPAANYNYDQSKTDG